MRRILILAIALVWVTPAFAQEDAEPSLQQVLDAVKALTERVNALSADVAGLKGERPDQPNSPKGEALPSRGAAGVKGTNDSTVKDIFFELGAIRKVAGDFTEAFPDDLRTLQQISTAIKGAIEQLQKPDPDVSAIRAKLKGQLAGVLLNNIEFSKVGKWTDKLKEVFAEIQGKLDGLGTVSDEILAEKLAIFYLQVVDVLDQVASRTTGDTPAFTPSDKNALHSWDKLWNSFVTKIEEESPSLPEAFAANVREYVKILKRIMEHEYDDDELASIKKDTFDATQQFINDNVDGTKPKKNMIDLYNAFVRWVENDSGDGDTVRGWQRNLLKLAGELNKYADGGYPVWFREAQERFGKVRPSSSSNTRRSGGRQSTQGYHDHWRHHHRWWHSNSESN